ncbi:MAG: hypothetical protein HN348_28950, partial [Proteobacteria bacterium]|nr:hypothetical protein [Pseudomonadota bacterium]
MRMVLLLPLLMACPKQRPIDVPAGLPLETSRFLNFHFFGGTEANAEHLLGRFVAEGVFPIDESNAIESGCSSHFLVERQQEATAHLGVFSTTSASASRAGANAAIVIDETQPIWVDHRPAGRAIAVIEDAHALATCCTEHPDACTTRYVSEIVEGEGEAYFRATDVEGREAWQRGSKLTGTLGFRLGVNPFVGDGCGSWQQQIPVTNRGIFFLGVSSTLSSEERAREDAMYQARSQARRWLRDEGRGDGALDLLGDFRWCVQSIPNSSGGVDHLAHVLTYIPLS